MRTVHTFAREWLRRVLLVGVAALVLAGCASRPGGVPADGSQADIATASDESAVRKRARVRLQLAVGYYQHGQTTVALDEIKQALAIDPGFADAYTLRGLAYMRLGDPALAEDSFRRALAINPRDGEVMHNYGWLLCQQQRYRDAQAQFTQALAMPNYTERAKTLMTQGICQMKAGQPAEAEASLAHAYEIDAANPVTGYNLALLLTQRGEWARAQFYIRRVNNGPAANAETLWLGIKVERQLRDEEAVSQLATQLQRRFPQSREAMLYERGNFND